MSRSKDASPISIQIDRGEITRRAKRGTANFLGAVARLVDPNFDRQDIRSLTPQERERSLVNAQRAANGRLHLMTIQNVQLGLLGGRQAAKTNPQAAKLLLSIEQGEKSLTEIKFDGEPVVNDDQMYQMQMAGLKAAEALRQASTNVIISALGVDQAISLTLQGVSAEKIVQPIDEILQQTIQMINQQKSGQ